MCHAVVSKSLNLHRTTNFTHDFHNGGLSSDMSKAINFHRTPNTPSELKAFCDLPSLFCQSGIISKVCLIRSCLIQTEDFIQEI